MNSWNVRKVAALEADGILKVEDGNHGEYRPRPAEFTSVGTAYIRAADIVNSAVDFTGASKINEIARRRIRKGIGRSGDVLLTHKGTVGRVALVKEDSPPFVCSPQTTFWRALRPNVVDRRFILQVLRSPSFVRQLGVRKDQTDMAPYVSLTEQRSMDFPVPPIEVQRAIVEVLGALDDKIAANTSLIARADEFSTTLFSSILDNADLAPLTEISRFVNGRAFTKDASGTGRVVIRIAELNSGLGASTVYNDIEVSDNHLAHPGDLLFAWSGSLTLHRWFRSEGIINQHIFKVIPIDGYPLWLVNQLLLRKLDEFKAIAADKATTMGHIQRRHLEQAVAVPSRSMIEKYDGAMTALWNAALNAEQESLRLGEFRDVLLPQLMSGKLRVKYAEKQVEAVV